MLAQLLLESLLILRALLFLHPRLLNSQLLLLAQLFLLPLLILRALLFLHPRLLRALLILHPL